LVGSVHDYEQIEQIKQYIRAQELV